MRLRAAPAGRGGVVAALVPEGTPAVAFDDPELVPGSGFPER